MYRRYPAPVSSPASKLLLSLGGLGSRCLQGYLRLFRCARGHGPPVTVRLLTYPFVTAFVCSRLSSCYTYSAAPTSTSWVSDSSREAYSKGTNSTTADHMVVAGDLAGGPCRFAFDFAALSSGKNHKLTPSLPGVPPPAAGCTHCMRVPGCKIHLKSQLSPPF